MKSDLLWVVGDARGADRIVADYATHSSIPLLILPALWDKYGKRAGILRNMAMVDISHIVIGFWDGKSNGTKQCITYAKSQNKFVHCYEMNPNNK
jgi:hypothetical protein